ncbi:MAG: mycofactocin biosynthesis chaperone MftB [Microbacterium sp.]
MSPVTNDTVLTVSGRVSIRPEPFGALLYHFGTRRLSFLKSPVLLRVIDGFDGIRCVGEAMSAAGVETAARPAVLRALGTLRESHMLEEAVAA